MQISSEIWDDCAVAFYDVLCSDPTLNRFFRGTKLSSLKDGQWCFFRQLWQGESCQLDPKLHQIWDITNSDFDKFLAILKEVIQMHVDETSMSQFLEELQQFRSMIVSDGSDRAALEKTAELDDMENANSQDIEDYLKQCLHEAMKEDPGQVPPEACLKQMVVHFEKARQLSKHERLSISHLRLLHQHSYVALSRYERIRSIIAMNPKLGQPFVLKALDEAEPLVTNGLRGRMMAANERKTDTGRTRLQDSVTMMSTVRSWYASMRSDSILSRFFGDGRSKSAAQVADRQFSFIQRLAMTSRTFSLDAQKEHIRLIHRALVITDSHFDRFIECLLSNCHHPDLKDDFMAFVEGFRPVVVRRLLFEQGAGGGAGSSCPVTGSTGQCPFSRPE